MRNTTYALAYLQRCLRQRLRGCLTLLCLSIVLAGCTMAPGDNLPNASTVQPTAQANKPPTANTVQPTVPGTILSFTTIAQGNYLSANLSLAKPKIIVIASAQEIDAALLQAGGNPSELTSRLHPIDKVRQLDFNHYVALLVLQGKQTTGGYGVTVQQIVQQDVQVIVRALFIEPKPGEGVTEAGTDPYHLVAIPKEQISGKLLTFELVDNTKVVAETTHFIP